MSSSDATMERALGRRPLLRKLATMTWSAFLGAALALVVWLLLPWDWLEPPVASSRLAALFAVCFLLALVPAAAQTALGSRRPRRWGPHAR